MEKQLQDATGSAKSVGDAPATRPRIDDSPSPSIGLVATRASTIGTSSGHRLYIYSSSKNCPNVWTFCIT